MTKDEKQAVLDALQAILATRIPAEFPMGPDGKMLPPGTSTIKIDPELLQPDSLQQAQQPKNLVFNDPLRLLNKQKQKQKDSAPQSPDEQGNQPTPDNNKQDNNKQGSQEKETKDGGTNQGEPDKTGKPSGDQTNQLNGGGQPDQKDQENADGQEDDQEENGQEYNSGKDGQSGGSGQDDKGQPQKPEDKKAGNSADDKGKSDEQKDAGSLEDAFILG